MTWRPHVHPKALALRLASILWGAGLFYWALDASWDYARDFPGDPDWLVYTGQYAIAAAVLWLPVGPLANWYARKIQRLYNPALAI